MPAHMLPMRPHRFVSRLSWLATYLRWSGPLLLLVALLLALSCYQRPIHLDEAWIGEQAYWAAHEGAVRSELFRGFQHAELRQLVYHKLFVWQGAGAIWLGGWSVTGLRLLSLSYALLAAGLCWQALGHLPLRYPVHSRALGVALLLANGLVVEFSFRFRPEVMVMTLGLASWLCLQQAAAASRRRLWYVAGAGLLAGLASLTHLNGLIFGAAGGILLLWRRQWGGAALFGLLAAGCGVAYFWEVARLGAWEEFWQQLRPAVQQPGGHGGWLYAQRLLQEHRRLFHSGRAASLTVGALLAAGVLYRHRRQLAGGVVAELALYTAVLVAGLSLLSQNDNSFYLLLYAPLLVLLITLALDHLAGRPGAVAAGAFVAAYLLVNLGSTVQLIGWRHSEVRDHQRLARHLAAYRGARVVAPLRFVFHEIEHFQVQGTFCYHLLAGAQPAAPALGAAFFDRAARFRRRLLLLDEEALRLLRLPRPRAGQRWSRYAFRHRYAGFYIYELQPHRTHQTSPRPPRMTTP